MKWYRFHGMALGIGILFCTVFRISVAGQKLLSTAKSGPSTQANNSSQQTWLMAQCGSSGAPYLFAFSPNGRILASSSYETTTLWDVATGAELGVLPEVGYNFAFTRDGTQLAALGYESTSQGFRGIALIWDVFAGKQIARIHCPIPWLNYSVFSPDARLVATFTSTPKNGIAICDIRADGKTWELEVPHDEERGSYGKGVFSPQGDRFAAIYSSKTDTPGSSNAKTLDVWDVKTGKHLRSIPDLAQRSQGMVYSPDGNHLAGIDGGEIVLWNITEGTSSRLLTPADTRVRALAFAASSKTIAGACTDHTLRLWNVETGKQIASFPVPASSGLEITGLAFAPNGQTIVCACRDNILRSWEVETGKQIASFPGTEDRRYPIPFSPDGRYLATHDGHVIKMWDVTTGKEFRQFHGTALSIRAAAFSPGGHNFALGDGAGAIHLWDTTKGQPVRTLNGHKLEILSLAFSPDGRWLVDSSWDDSVHVWDLKTGTLAHAFPRESPPLLGLRRGALDHDPAWQVCFSPDSKLVAAAGADNVRVWEAGSWKRRFTLKGHYDRVDSVLFTQDGKRIIMTDSHSTHTSSEGEVLAWDAKDGKFLQELSQPLSSPNASFGNLVAPTDPMAGWFAASNRYGIVLWDTHTWKAGRVLDPPKSAVSGAVLSMMAGSPDGKLLAGGYGGMLCLWDVETGSLLDSITLHANTITSVAFSPDGTHLLTGGLDTTARLWAIQANRLQPLCTLYLFQDNTWAVADAQNRFDAPQEGDVGGLHGVAAGKPIPLSQLKSRYYDPGLLAKYLGQNRAPLKRLDLP